jgi:DNA-binding transcriptional LysR family regulator
MQLKRLEEALGLALLDRSARTIALTTAGEQLLGYARRMLDLNDEVFGRMTHQAFEGEITLGVPHDIIYPAIPQVLNRFNIEYPRVRVQLLSSYTKKLKELYAQGKCDVMLTTEDGLDEGGETINAVGLEWIGAPNGSAWKQRPLKLAFEQNCIFRRGVQKALDDEGIAWEMAVDSDSTRTIEAIVSADLAVHAIIAGTKPPYVEAISHGGALPDLATQNINLYQAEPGRGPVSDDLCDLVRQAFRVL